MDLLGLTNMTPISPHTLEEGQRDHRQSPNQPLDTARDPCGKQPQAFISRNSAQHTMQTLLSTSCWDPHKHWWALRQHPEIVLPSCFCGQGSPRSSQNWPPGDRHVPQPLQSDAVQRPNQKVLGVHLDSRVLSFLSIHGNESPIV